MASSVPLWLQRLPGDLKRRLELSEAKAREARMQTHAEQAIELVRVLAPRMPFDEAVDRYIDIMSLGGEEEETVRTRALAMLGDVASRDELARERGQGRAFSWKYATPVGALRFIRRQLRRNAEEDLWMELVAARAEEAVIRTHFKHALAYAEILEDHAPPTQSVALYLDRLEIPAMRARSVYQRVLARLAEDHLPRIAEAAATNRPRSG